MMLSLLSMMPSSAGLIIGDFGRSSLQALIANPIANVAMRLDVKKQCFKHIFERLVDRSLWAVMPILIRLSIV
ncbi:hypothetical protein EJK55_0828 [Moraxella catarrhalis]|nr:hypothetical protein EJK52_0192 [Moraxella catarrhalis]AZQ91142.1 hypothetical protein EJK51_0191 [Moraxella catarrhalis]EGE17162.1 hypothetical protein E9O_01386 [Moraxella catarrhalis 12P80B1]RUO15790.1 hypothetical protein EJK55_0828 [Moraxella catarrhalis]